ncbi:MAG: glycosyltransferase family 9 protein [bacterium]
MEKLTDSPLQRMKILVISNFYPPYCLSGYPQADYGKDCKKKIDELTKKGHEIKILTSMYGVNKFCAENQVYRLLSLNIPGQNINKSTFTSLKDNFALKNLLNKFNPDLIYIFNMWGIEKSILLTLKASQKPIVFDIVDYWITDNTSYDNWLFFKNENIKTTILRYISLCLLNMFLKKKFSFNESLGYLNSEELKYAYFCSESLKNKYQEFGFNVYNNPVISNDSVTKIETHLQNVLSPEFPAYVHRSYPKLTNKILVVMPQSFGDVYRTTAILSTMKSIFLEKQIHFMTKKKCFPLLISNPDIEKLIEYPDSFSSPYGCAAFLTLPMSECLIKSYDKIYLPYDKVQIEFITNREQNFRSHINIVELFAKFCDIKKNEIQRPFLSEELIETEHKNFIIIHPATFASTRNWDFFPELVKEIKKYKNIDILQVGWEWDPLIPGCKDCKGLSFGKLATLIKGASLFIGIDSFPAHLAGGINTPSILIFGGSESSFSKPYWGSPTILEPERPKECKFACYSKECLRGKKCINFISIDRVMQEIRRRI